MTTAENKFERQINEEATRVKTAWSESKRARELWTMIERSRDEDSTGESRGPTDTLRRAVPYAAALIVVVAAALSGPGRALAEQAWRLFTRSPSQSIIIRPTDEWHWQRGGKRLASDEVEDVTGSDPATPTAIADTRIEILSRVWYEDAGRLLTPFELLDESGETLALPLLTEYRPVDGEYRFYLNDQVPEDVETQRLDVGNASGELIPGGWLSDDPREPYEQRWTDRLVQLRWQEEDRILNLEVFRGSLSTEELLELARGIE
jgi:hypothetical protein